MPGGDTVELGRIPAPGFTLVGACGAASTVTRAKLMQQVSQGMLAADSSSVSDITVNGGGDSATADLTFTQATSAQDLDVHWYNAAGTDLTPCSPADSSTCNLANGQSADANEHFTFTAPAACSTLCTYYLVVRGWDGATNRYDVTIRVP